MPRMSPEVLEGFLQQPHIGVLASLRRDGRPYTVPTWWLWKDGAFWLTGTYARVWCKQLKEDGRMSLCIEAMSPVAGHVGVDGVAEARELPAFDIWPISRELVEKYVGGGRSGNLGGVEEFFARMQTEPRLLFRVQPQVWRAIDMRVYCGKRADREHQARAGSAEG